MTHDSNKTRPLIAAALVAGLSLGQFVNASETASIQKTLSETTTALEVARKGNNSWSTTTQLMTAARDALAAGDTATAQELAERALLTANRAQQQASLEKNAWQARVPAPAK